MECFAHLANHTVIVWYYPENLYSGRLLKTVIEVPKALCTLWGIFHLFIVTNLFGPRRSLKSQRWLIVEVAPLDNPPGLPLNDLPQHLATLFVALFRTLLSLSLLCWARQKANSRTCDSWKMSGNVLELAVATLESFTYPPLPSCCSSHFWVFALCACAVGVTICRNISNLWPNNFCRCFGNTFFN